MRQALPLPLPSHSQVNSKMRGMEGPASTFVESFAALQGVMETVATFAIPPPGGQIIVAAIAIGVAIIKGAMNVKQCCELATWCSKLLQQVIYIITAMVGEELYLSLCCKVHLYCSEVQMVQNMLQVTSCCSLLN